MEKDELHYKMALSKVDGVGPVRYKKLMELFGSAQEVFKQKPKRLKAIAGISEAKCQVILGFNQFDRIEKEIAFAAKNNIQIIDYESPLYPSKLRQCVDSPIILFYKGNANLNHPKIISVIGTRLSTEYGKRICEELIEELKPYDVLITSGLALGIDAIAHKASIKANMPTLGVVAHGLDIIYPAANRNLASEMLLNGGLLTEYYSNAIPDKGNFPSRNRIVAGISDATLIIETDRKGGSMITAEIAYSYNRDVFCVPGRITDAKSSGCNYLLKSLKAQMVTSADDIAESLGWTKPKKQKPTQRQLFIELNTNEHTVVELLKTKEQMHVDEFYNNSPMNSSELASTLLSLEMQNIIRVLPGKLISLID